MKLNAVKVVLYTSVVATAVTAVYLYNAHFPLFDELTEEDHLVEWTQFWLLVAASAALFVAWGRQQFRNWFTLGYGLLFFLVAGEEIDWGSRIFGNGVVGDPGSGTGINVQGEFNIHNIRGVHHTQRLVGLIMFVGIAFVIPLTYRYWPVLRKKLYQRFDVPVSPLWTMPIAVVALAFQVIPRAFMGGNIFGFDEMGELYTYLVFLILALDTLVSTLTGRRADDVKTTETPEITEPASTSIETETAPRP